MSARSLPADDADAGQALLRALDEAEVGVDAERVVIRPADDALLAALGRKVQVGGNSRVRLGTNTVDAMPVPPTLVYRLQLGGGRGRPRAGEVDRRVRDEHRARRRAKAQRRRLARRAAKRQHR